MREIKFKFIIDGDKLSEAYTLEQIMRGKHQLVFENITGRIQYTGINHNDNPDFPIYEGDIIGFSDGQVIGVVTMCEYNGITGWWIRDHSGTCYILDSSHRPFGSC